MNNNFEVELLEKLNNEIWQENIWIYKLNDIKRW